MKDWLKNKNRPTGRGTGVDGAATTSASLNGGDGELDGTLIVGRRHTDWMEHQVRWRWLLDSYEGGDRYRNAVYGPDRRGFPCRNLFRHKREYPDPQSFPTGVGSWELGGEGSSFPDPQIQSPSSYSGTWPGQLGTDPGAWRWTTTTSFDAPARRSRSSSPRRSRFIWPRSMTRKWRDTAQRI